MQDRSPKPALTPNAAKRSGPGSWTALATVLLLVSTGACQVCIMNVSMGAAMNDEREREFAVYVASSVALAAFAAGMTCLGFAVRGHRSRDRGQRDAP